MLRRASEQLRYFLSAVMFLTRIPCPAWLGYEPHYLSMARWYFPVVGSLLGLLAGLVFYVCSLILPVSVALLLSIITLINITGAFHEDGLADSADGFGGAYEKAGVLRIMKDSRIGTYGTVALISALSLKFFILLELANIEPWYVLIILPIAHSYSRFFAGSLVDSLAYVQDEDGSKSKPIAEGKYSRLKQILCFLVASLPMLAIPRLELLCVIPACFALRWYCAAWFTRRIGGYTGDALGLVQQLSELTIYILALAVFTSLG